MAKRPSQSQPHRSPAPIKDAMTMKETPPAPERLIAERPAVERPAAERIVEVARELFCRDGIHATGIDRILSTAGASKMTLYTRFGSKEALVREVLLREGAEWRSAFFEAIETRGDDPMEKLLQVVPALGKWFHSGRFYGCSFMNAAAEHSKGEPILREMATQHHRCVLDFLETLTQAAGLHEPALVARQILLTIDGTIAALMVSGDPTVLTVAHRNLNSILTQAKLSPNISAN
jgi:AcrR family transcriptional regulator